MKKLLVLLGFVMMCLLAQSQTCASEVAQNKDVVINRAMIERFNNMEYSTEQFDFQFILTNYSFDDAKEVLLAFRSGDLKESTVESVANYLATLEKDYEEINIPASNKEVAQIAVLQQQ